MKKSAKIDYACRAILELGLHWPDKTPMQLALIARKQKIPMKFLTQIILNLKQMGIVESLRGKAGGYVLVKAPAEINLIDVMKHFNALELNNGKKAGSSELHVMDLIWQDIDKCLCEHLEKINFENICNRHCRKDNVMTFEI